MHSIHVLKKRERDASVAQRLQKKEVTNLAAHRAKTRKLAENYETRVDGWLVNTQQGKIDAVPRVRLACHHTFRERSRELELGHDRVSPQLYTSERERIGRELTHGSSSLVMRDRWAPKRGSLFREREPGKECQPAMVYRPRTSNDRINEEISKMPVMPLQPWTRFDHPSYRKFRPDDPTKHVGGRFQLDLTKGERTPKPEKNFLFSQIPFAAPFGARSDDFRPADDSMHIEGPFYNIVPGYSPDSLPGVWRMDAEISGPPISPTYWNEHAGRPRTSSPDPASDTVKSPSSRQSQAGTRLSSPNRSCYSRTLKSPTTIGSPVKGDVPYPLPKTYWKAIGQVSTANPLSAAFYEQEIGHEKSFDDHAERAQQASRTVRQHLGVAHVHRTVGRNSGGQKSPPVGRDPLRCGVFAGNSPMSVTPQATESHPMPIQRCDLATIGMVHPDRKDPLGSPLSGSMRAFSGRA